MMRKFWPVHTAPVRHLSTADAMAEVRAVTVALTSGQRNRVISDQCAQTIASWWHSPQSPYSTRLSTGGHVERYVDISDFLAPDLWERTCETVSDVDALRRLRDYLRHHQVTAPSGARPCACDDCPDIVYGAAGELCETCDESGCDAEFTALCEREDTYTEN